MLFIDLIMKHSQSDVEKILTLLAETPQRIDELVEGWDEETLRRSPGARQWSAFCLRPYKPGEKRQSFR